MQVSEERSEYGVGKWDKAESVEAWGSRREGDWRGKIEGYSYKGEVDQWNWQEVNKFESEVKIKAYWKDLGEEKQSEWVAENDWIL
jgi:hypothetical protein